MAAGATRCSRRALHRYSLAATLRGRSVRRGGEDEVMETFTIREAAERCQVSYEALRRRVDRGSV